MVEEAAKGRKRFIAWFDGPDKPEDCPMHRGPRSRRATTRTSTRPRRRAASSSSPAARRARRRAPRARSPSRSTRRRRCSARSRCARASRGWSPPRCSTPGASRTSRSGWGSRATLVLRRKFDPETDAERHGPARVHGARRRAGDAPAHPRAGRGDDREVRPQCAAVHRRLGLRAARRAGHASVMDAFGDKLYNLYGSTEVAWATIATPKDLREAPGTAGRPPRGTIVKLYDEDGKEVAAGRDRPHLRRQRDALRGLHRRRQQGPHRRADVDRRRRPLRRGRAAVRRRPRRRDDRLRRRERLPPRGRGPARRPPEDRRGRGRRRRRRGVRPAPRRVRRQVGRRPERGRGQEARQGEPRQLQGPARRRSSSTSCRATRPARCVKKDLVKGDEDASDDD